MKYRFGRVSLLSTKVTASTLLETIVASVIFMIVFAMAIDTLTRIMIFDHKDSEYLLIESSFGKCDREMRSKKIIAGNESYTFDWGEIHVSITNDKKNLYHIEMNAVTKSKKEVSYQYIIADEATIE